MNTLKLSTGTVWLICIIASIGFLFDIYELLMLPLIIKDALADLGGIGPDGRPNLIPGEAEYTAWARWLFFAPAIVGGIFGLFGGYLTDLFGRRRVLTFSILLYAFSAAAAGFATSLWMLLILRCLVFVGVCVEFVAAVAWLAELFDDRDTRERVLGYTQAFSSFGGILISVMFGLISRYASYLPAIYGEHDPWRYTLISGVIPALPLILIRPFLPESPKWAAQKAAGTLRRPSIGELFQPALVRTTLVTTLMFAGSYGIAFGAIQQIPQIISAHKVVVEAGTARVAQATEAAAAAGSPAPEGGRLQAIRAQGANEEVAAVQAWQEVGGLLGRFALAALVVHIVSRRRLFRLFQIPSLLFVPAFFYWLSGNLEGDSLLPIKIGIAIAGFLTVAQFSFWGNYIPLVFPLHLRGTGESFAANIGGRILGTAAAWITLTLAPMVGKGPASIAITAAVVAGGYALVAAILTFFMPEPEYGSEH